MYGVPDFYQNDNVKKGTGMQWRHQVVSDLPSTTLRSSKNRHYNSSLLVFSPWRGRVTNSLCSPFRQNSVWPPTWMLARTPRCGLWPHLPTVVMSWSVMGSVSVRRRSYTIHFLQLRVFGEFPICRGCWRQTAWVLSLFCHSVWYLFGSWPYNKGPFKCYVTFFYHKFDTHPPLRNAS